MVSQKPEALKRLEKTISKVKQTPSAGYDPKKQVEGYQKRLTAAGIPTTKITDSRNPLEKVLNLRPNQNVFFDVLEVVGRPQQALVGGITAAQEGKDVFQGVKQGFTGEAEYKSFKDVLVNAGFYDAPNEINFSDVAGTVLDIFADPIDIAFIAAAPVTGGGSLAIKGALAALDNAQDAFRVAGTAENLLDAAGVITKSVKGDLGQSMANLLKKAADANNLLDFEDAVNGFKALANSAMKPSRLLSPLEFAAKGVKNGVGYSLGFADDVIEKVLSSWDLARAATDPKLAKAAKNFITDAINLTNYKNLKDAITGIFNKAKLLPEGLMNKLGNIQGKSKWFDEQAEVLLKVSDEQIDKWAKAWNMPKEEVSRMLLKTIEFDDLKYKTSLMRVLTDEDNMRNVAKSLDEVQRIKDFLVKNNILDAETVDNLFNKITRDGVDFYFYKPQFVEDTMRSVKRFMKDTAAKDKTNFRALITNLTTDYDAPRFYSEKAIDEINIFKNMPGANEAINEARTTIRKLYGTLDMSAGSEYARTALRGPEVLAPRAATEEALETFPTAQYSSYANRRLRGNAKVSAERIYRMSAYEANEMSRAAAQNLLGSDLLKGKYEDFFKNRANMDIFQEELNKTLADFVVKKSKTSFQANTVQEIFAAQTFADPKLVSAFESGQVPLGKSTVSKAQLVQKIKDLVPYQANKDGLEAAVKAVKKIKGETLVIENNLLDLLALPKDTNGVKNLMLLLDKFNGMFKSLKLLSPGFHMRNLFGNYTNMMLAGIDPLKLNKYTPDAARLMSNGPELIERAVRANAQFNPAVLNEIFSPDELRLYNLLQEYTQANLPKSAGMLFDYPDEVVQALKKDPTKRNLVDSALAFNAGLNDKTDTFFRLQAYMYAKDNPQLLTRLNLAKPEDLVRRALFDPNDLSVTEKDFLKRIVPFYTFTKKNLAYQMQNVFDNPKIYKRIAKAFDSAWTMQDIDPYKGDVEEYKRTNFWLPVWRFENGEYVAAKLNLPIGDLAEWLSDPLNRSLSSLTPYLRAPFEVATNRQIYSGLPIQEFQGQRGYNLDFLPRGLEYGLSQTGFDVPVAAVTGTFQQARGLATGQITPSEALSQGLLQSVISRGDPQRAQRSKAYDDLRRMQELIAYSKQEGIDVPTLAEIENKNSPLNQTIKKIKQRLG